MVIGGGGSQKPGVVGPHPAHPPRWANSRSTVNSNRVPHLKKPVDIKKDSNPKINNPESTDSENKHFFANASPSLTKRPSNLTLCSKGSQDDEANN